MTESSSATIENLRKLIGTRLEPTVFRVEEGAIQRYAEAIGDRNPLYNDADYARKSKHGRLMCPPGFTGWPVKGGRITEGPVELLVKSGAPSRLLDGGVEFEFFEPIGAGDILVASTTISDITEKQTRLGRTIFATIEITYVNQNGNLALEAKHTFIMF
jgi:acyl dehydratase